MRVLFVSAQMPGHLDWGGYLQTAAETSRRGHETLWASGPEVRTAVRLAAVPFHTLANTGWRWPPPPPLSPDAVRDADSLRLLRQERALDQWLDVERVAHATQELDEVARTFRPDLIVSEMFVAAAGLVAEMRNAPLAIAGWPAPVRQRRPSADATEPMATHARDRLQALLDRFQLDGGNWTAHGPPALRSPHLHLTYWSPSWFGTGEPQPPDAHVGGIAPQAPPAPPADLPSPDMAPWVLITLGTSFNRDPNFFINAAHAAHRLGCLPLVVFGSDLAARLGPGDAAAPAQDGSPTRTGRLHRRAPVYAGRHPPRRRGNDPRTCSPWRPPDRHPPRRRPVAPGARRRPHRRRACHSRRAPPPSTHSSAGSAPFFRTCRPSANVPLRSGWNSKTWAASQQPPISSKPSSPIAGHHPQQPITAPTEDTPCKP